MSRELISRATRNEFREVLTSFVLREIDMIFEAANIEARWDVAPQIGGQRRARVEQYYADINFSSPADVQKVVDAFEEVIERLQRLQSDVMNPNPQATQNTINGLLRRMERDGFRFEKSRFHCDKLRRDVIQAPSLVALTEASIAEHVGKARAKIEVEDNAGAIASAYTLIEGFLKELLRRTGTAFNESEGDIRELYKIAAEPLNLNPKGEQLESYLKAILQGLKSQLAGLYELANKASDRHARRYNPAGHHAKLAVNAAFTLCEFLLDSFEYQQKRKDRKAAAP